MEGIGYWIFLLILYLLSGLLKKRQKEAARRRLLLEEEDPNEPQPESKPQPDWLKDIFQDLSGLDEDLETDIVIEDFEDEPVPEQKEDVEVVISPPEVEDTFSLEPIERNVSKPSNLPTRGFQSLLRNQAGLRNAILLKEILDKPLALRSEIY